MKAATVSCYPSCQMPYFWHQFPVRLLCRQVFSMRF